MKPINVLLIILSVAGLITVRFLEDKIFYDPFLAYFKDEIKVGDFPKFDDTKLILGYLLRFILNLVFSTIIIQNLFRNKTWTKQAVVLMLLVFAIVFPIYLWCIYTDFKIGNLFAFYIRRFVIQPMTLLLIVPIFYYRKHLQSKTA
ncbi:exosortase F system-associated protein [Soonwooa sp.]|uniref:exosortase F system-associated membrane protein n=1 Tax=Soonwooa sp. TaxID=1938592 RepID=UPI00261E2D4B|nr:exosortase F system-associated protein [Soonwooa sp.]